jgi:alginate O-acetyltransferase complex protein AlgI
MSITSLNFILFIALALAIYYLLPRRSQNIWLLLLSYVFAITWDWQFAFVLGLVTVTNFLLAQKLVINNQGQRALLWIGIGFNMSILV